MPFLLARSEDNDNKNTDDEETQPPEIVITERRQTIAQEIMNFM